MRGAQALSAGGSGAGPRAFAVQYTSLILILLTYTLGVFRAAPEFPPSVNELQLDGNGVAIRPGRVLGAEFPLPDLFLPNTVEINREQLEVLIQVLRNHDVEAVIRVRHLPQEASFGVARAARLTQSFLAEGIPMTALRIVAEEAPEESSGVTFQVAEGV